MNASLAAAGWSPLSHLESAASRPSSAYPGTCTAHSRSSRLSGPTICVKREREREREKTPHFIPLCFPFFLWRCRPTLCCFSFPPSLSVFTLHTWSLSLSLSLCLSHPLPLTPSLFPSPLSLFLSPSPSHPPPLSFSPLPLTPFLYLSTPFLSSNFFLPPLSSLLSHTLSFTVLLPTLSFTSSCLASLPSLKQG